MNQVSFVFKFIAIVGFISLLNSCAPPSSRLDQPADLLKTRPNSITQSEKTPAEVDPVDYELAPTFQPAAIAQNTLARYEVPKAELKNKQIVLHLNQVKMSKVTMTYDSTQRRMKIEGFAKIIDDHQKELAENSFLIFGVHPKTESAFNLSPESQEKSDSNSKPVIRAQATCLALNAKDETDCSRVIIDFFIAYKQKIYTEQMEIKSGGSQSSALPPKPVPSVQTPSPPVPTVQIPSQPTLAPTTPEITPPILAPQTPAPVLPAVTQPETLKTPDLSQIPPAQAGSVVLQTEEPENSIPGRFVGQSESVDLVTLFDEHDEIQKVLKPNKTGVNPVVVAEPKKEDPTVKPKTITSDVEQTVTGIIRPLNQAIGYPNKGRMRNASSLLAKQEVLNKKAYFEVTSPNRARYFATYEMAEILTRMGNFLHQNYERRLMLSDISELKGGLLSSHRSHQIGMDADIGYPATDSNIKFPVVVEKKSRNFHSQVFSIEKTFDLLKFTMKQPDLPVDRFFIDRTIKKALCDYAKTKGEFTGKDKDLVQNLFHIIEHYDGHGDHFHLRLKCTSAHPGCQKMVYLANNGCE